MLWTWCDNRCSVVAESIRLLMISETMQSGEKLCTDLEIYLLQFFFFLSCLRHEIRFRFKCSRPMSKLMEHSLHYQGDLQLNCFYSPRANFRKKLFSHQKKSVDWDVWGLWNKMAINFHLTQSKLLWLLQYECSRDAAIVDTKPWCWLCYSEQ